MNQCCWWSWWLSDKPTVGCCLIAGGRGRTFPFGLCNPPLHTTIPIVDSTIQYHLSQCVTPCWIPHLSLLSGTLSISAHDLSTLQFINCMQHHIRVGLCLFPISPASFHVPFQSGIILASIMSTSILIGQQCYIQHKRKKRFTLFQKGSLF